MKKLKLLKLDQDKRARKTFGRLVPVFLTVVVLTSLAIFLTVLSGSSSVTRFIFSPDNLKSDSGRVNILLLGIAGGIHDGANLTDTIMVASYSLKTNQTFLFSIPRDLWLPSLKAKANAVYQLGLLQNNGLGLTKTVMGNILGIPISHALRIDFRGFIQAVNLLGGIDVYVDKSFDDLNFPIEGKENDLCGYEEKEMDISEDQAKQLNIEPGKRKMLFAPDGKIATEAAQEDQGAKYFSCRFEHISFNKGLIHMDGATALKFVRSRHGTNGEGSDFSRSKRQTKVIEAVKSRLLSSETLLNPGRLSDLIKTFGKSIDTDISIKEAVEFYNLSKKMDKTYNFVLDDSPKTGLEGGRRSLLIHPSASDYGGAYVLISQDDDFSIIQGYVKKTLNGEISEYEATAAARLR